MADLQKGIKFQPTLGVKPPVPSKPVTPGITPQQTSYNRVQYDPNAILDTLQAMILNARYRININKPQMPGLPTALKDYQTMTQQAYGQPRPAQSEVEKGLGVQPEPVQYQSPWAQDPYGLGVSSFMQPSQMQVNPNSWYGVDASQSMTGTPKKTVRWNGEQEDWMNKPLVRQQTLLEQLLNYATGKKTNPENPPANPPGYYGNGGWFGSGGGGGRYNPGYDFFFNLLNWRI